jgi:uroporphyrinogen decarboxylase
MIVFSRGSNWEESLEALGETKYDCVGLDWTIDPGFARMRMEGKSKSLQGNLDPAVLYAPPRVIKREVFEMLSKFGTKKGLVANLGHGMEPEMNPEHARAFLEAVREFSASSLL